MLINDRVDVNIIGKIIMVLIKTMQTAATIQSNTNPTLKRLPLKWWRFKLSMSGWSK